MTPSAIISAEETETLAEEAREAINARLSLIPDGERCDFWRIVAKLYARGLAAPQLEICSNSPPTSAERVRDV